MIYTIKTNDRYTLNKYVDNAANLCYIKTMVKDTDKLHNEMQQLHTHVERIATALGCTVQQAYDLIRSDIEKTNGKAAKENNEKLS